MSQGLTWIAGRRTPLLALVALLALAVGMFAAFQPAHAALGEVNATTGTCSTTEITPATTPPTNSIGFGDGSTVRVVSKIAVEADVTAGATGLDGSAVAAGGEIAILVPCLATDVGKTIKITPDGTSSPITEVQRPALSITLSDTDGIVNDDSTLTATVSAKNFNGFTEDASTPITINHIRVSGVLDIAVNAVDGTVPTAIGNGASVTATVEIPEGSPEGEYTVSARVNYAQDDDANTANTVVNASKVFTVGDAGTNAAGLELSLATSANDIGTTPGNEQVDETGTAGASGSIWLKVAATNSLGGKSNDGAALSSLSVIAPGGTVQIWAPGAADSTPIDATPAVQTSPPAEIPTGATATSGEGNDSASFTGPEDVMFINIGKKGNTPGTVDVYALLIGADGAPRSENVTLTFTGGASELTLGDAPNVGANDSVGVEFTIDATDGGGNAIAQADIGRATFKVTDADGKAVSTGKVAVTKQTQGAHTTETVLDDNGVQATGLVTTGVTAAAGTYTITVTLVGVADSAATTEITVVGKPADVALEASATSSDTLGDIITVTATLTDADGNAVANGIDVDFSVSTNTGLSAIGSDHSGTDGPKTKDGAASVKFAVVGAGTSVVSATASGISNVVVLTSTAGQAAVEEVVDEPAPEPVDGLSQTELNNFASWSGEGSVSGSELLAGIAGATGVLFYDGDSWQHYGVSDGQVIPGSRDFTIRSGQTIWISG